MTTEFKLFFVVLFALTCNTFGQNLYIGDTSAETETDTLTRGRYSSEQVIYTWDNSTAFNGNKSIRIDWNDNKKLLFPFISMTRSHDLKKGETYTFSFYAKSSENDYPITVELRHPGAVAISKRLKLSQEWKRHTITFIAKKSNYINPLFVFRSSPKGQVWYDAVQLEKGNKTSNYQRSINVGVNLNSENWSNIYFPNQEIIATILTDIPDDQKAELKCKVIDYQGNTVKEFKQSVNHSGEIAFPLKIDRLGWFKITASLIIGGKSTISHSTNFIRIKEPVKIVDKIEPFSGVISVITGKDDTAIHKKIGVKRMEIIVSWGLPLWDGGAIESTPGEFDWSEFSKKLKTIKNEGMTAKIIVNPFSAPDWLFPEKTLDKLKQMNLSRRSTGLVLDRSKHHYWSNFLSNMMRQYGDMIDEIELGAEDNGRLGHNAYYKKLYPEHVKGGYLCGGKPFDDLCNMIKVGAEEIRKTHPHIKISAIRPSQGRVGENWNFVEDMFKVVGRDFNVFGIDTYLAVPFTYGPDFNSIQRAGTLDGRFYTYNLAKSYTKKYGVNQPIFISESGMSIDARYPDESIYRQQQAEMMVKDFITSKTAGFYAYDWFMGATPCPLWYNYSIFMSQYCRPQSVMAAYSAAAQIVENVTETKWLTPDRITRIAVLRKHDGKGIAAIWADDGYTLRLPEEQANHITVTDMMGNVLPYGNGAFALTSAPLCIKHDNYNALCDIMGKAKIDLTEWGQIKFRMITPELGRIQFVNLSNTVDLEINAVISVGGIHTTELINVPRGSTNSCNIALKGDAPIDVKASIEGSDSKLTASFTPDTPVDIGQGNDAQSKIASIQANNDILPNEPWVPWSGTNDLSANIFSSWDEDYLYLRFVVKDDVHKNKFEQPWGGDSIQVAIDPKNNAAFFDRKGNNIIGPDHFEFGMALNDDGKIIYKHAFGKELCIPDDYSVVRDEKAGTTTYSLRMPWKKLKVKPYSGMVFGMSFVVFDDDDGTGQSYYGFIGGGITGALGGKNAALYKKFVLK